MMMQSALVAPRAAALRYWQGCQPTRRRCLYDSPALCSSSVAAPTLPGGQVTVGPHVVPESELEGLIFDLDGTLIDSMPLFYPAWPETCENFDLPPLTLEEFYGFAGVPMPDIVRAIHRNAAVQCDDERCEQFLDRLKAAQAREEARKGSPQRIECVISLATTALAAGKRVAVATSGVKEHVRSHLALTGLDQIFSEAKGNLVCASDLPPGRGKPLPDIYLEAARRIGCKPCKCRAYEDGESGLCAAYRAGMHVIDVTAMKGGRRPINIHHAHNYVYISLVASSRTLTLNCFLGRCRVPVVGWVAQSKGSARARSELATCRRCRCNSSKSMSNALIVARSLRYVLNGHHRNTGHEGRTYVCPHARQHNVIRGDDCEPSVGTHGPCNRSQSSSLVH